MARVANKDKEFVDKGRKFLRYLMEEGRVSHISIGRIVSIKNTSKIRDCNVGTKNVMKIIKAYSNNYIRWCRLKGLQVELELEEYLRDLYS